MRALSRIIANNWTVLDIGANIGYMTAFFSTLCPAGRVYAFEPAPRCAPHLMRLADERHNVRYIQAACGSKVGRLSFDEKPRLDLSHLSSDGKVSVDVVTVDRWCSENGVAPVALVKIDTEGADADVVMGAGQIIREFRPVLMFEAHTESEFKAVLSGIANAGYAVKQIMHNGELRTGWHSDGPRNFLAMSH